MIAKLMEFSPFDEFWQILIVSVPLGYFVVTVIGYIKEGILDRTENMFSERNFITTYFMYGLIGGEIIGFAFILGGFIYTQLFLNGV